MKTNIFKSKAMRLGAFALLGGALISTTGCSKDNINNLFFTVKGEKLEVVFCDRGASVYSMKYDGKYVTYHPKNKKTFITNNYYGKCVGRITGRIPDGNLRVGSKEYNLEINETKGGKNNCLHGGTNGLFNKNWTHTIVEKENYYEVIFKYVSPAGESGFPETLNVRYVYRVSKTDGKLDIVIDAGASGLTPVNLTFHPYIRLGDSGTVENHTLKLDAKYMGEYDSEGHQTVMKSIKIEGESPWDFSSEKTIGKDVKKAAELDPASNGYDHIWHFRDDDGKPIDFNVSLTNPDTKLKLDVTSEDSDGVIMYTNCWKVDGQEMNDGELDAQYAAITIEPYTFFTTEQQSIEKMFIDKGKSFSRHITYNFSSTN